MYLDPQSLSFSKTKKNEIKQNKQRNNRKKQAKQTKSKHQPRGVVKIQEMVISGRRFAENEKEMHGNKKKHVKSVQNFCFC